VSKTFGEWSPTTHKTEGTNKLALLAFKIIAILHSYTGGTVHKASGNCHPRLLSDSIPEQLSGVVGLPPDGGNPTTSGKDRL
jgi:hypothetical protein